MGTKTAGKNAVTKSENLKDISKEGLKETPKKLSAGPSVGKVEKKVTKSSEIDLDSDEAKAALPPVDLDELEEHEDAAASESAAAGGNAAALAAAASSPTEMSASFKNFRHHPDMENFYRFIFENDLRHEALAIIDDIISEKAERRLVKGAKVQPH